MRVRRLAVWAVCGALVVSACGGGGSDADESTTGATTVTDTGVPDDDVGDESGGGADEQLATSAPDPTTTTSTTTTEPPLAVASAELIDANVEYRTVAAPDFSDLVDPVDVAVGDTVRTDSTGFAVIAYFDGSLTRLDVDTEFEVLELVDGADTSAVRTRMGLGRTWHRVETLGEGDEFSVETSVATAVVQGTAFSVTCVSDEECSFLVVEGDLLVVLLDGTEIELVAPASLAVTTDGPGDIVEVPFDGAFGDEWLFDNADRDTAEGFASSAEIYQTHGIQYASIVGDTFTGTRTITDRACDPICRPGDAGEGDVAERSYVFEIDCSNGVPCTGTIDTEYSDGTAVLTETVPLSFDGTSYRWTLENTNPNCVQVAEDGTVTDSSGNLSSFLTWEMSPSTAEVIDDRWVVTALTGTGTATNTVTDPGICPPELLGSSVSAYSIEVTRSP